jgi:hypothetical protein
LPPKICSAWLVTRSAISEANSFACEVSVFAGAPESTSHAACW